MANVDGNNTQAAKNLGIDRKALREKAIKLSKPHNGVFCPVETILSNSDLLPFTPKSLLSRRLLLLSIPINIFKYMTY
jgi:hypothetical protein